MIETKKFYDYLFKNELDLFAGVPDSLLKNLCAYINDNCDKDKNIITANEGNAIAIVAGYHLSTGKYGVVYMQNSGVGNAINPLLSLADEEVYSIPMLLIVGWRGEPGTKDEPQHIKQGKVTLPLFQTMDIETLILEENYEQQIDYCVEYMKNRNKPIALIVQKDSFTDYKTTIQTNNYSISREEALDTIIRNLADHDFMVTTTGKTSREVYELREIYQQGHSNDFLTVGSMGHTASIAFGMSIGTKKAIYCIDGDGSFLMHTGGFAFIAQNAKNNLKYILINNGAHESVGGQPTVALDIDIPMILKGFGFKNVYEASNLDEINDGVTALKANKKLSALIIYTKQGSRKDLGRPKTTPIENKIAFMDNIQK